MGLEDQIGSIEEGKRADIILIGRIGLHNQPMVECNPYLQLVYQHRSSDVDTVIVDGSVVYSFGELSKLDTEEVRIQVNKSIERVLKRANLRG